MLSGQSRKLPGIQLEKLLTKLYSFFYDLEPPNLRHEGKNSREFIANCMKGLPQDGLNGPDAKAAVAEVAASVAEWLASYLE